MSSPRTSLRSVLRLRLVFEGAGEPGIFSVPESRGNFGIYSQYYIEADSLFRGGELKIFLILIDFPHIFHINFFIFPTSTIIGCQTVVDATIK